MEGGRVTRLSGGAARGLEGATWSALHHHDGVASRPGFTPLRPGCTAVYILVKRLESVVRLARFVFRWLGRVVAFRDWVVGSVFVSCSGGPRCVSASGSGQYSRR